MPDHHKASGSKNGIKIIALLFPEIKKLFTILEKDFYRPSPGIIF
jgi:hypothetical protein